MPEFIEKTDWKPPAGTVASVGAFDGIHKGHQMIIERLIDEARQKGLKSLLFTFDPHPKQILFPDKKIKLLTVKPEKKQILSKYPLDYVFFYPFNLDFARMSGEAFLHFLKKNYGLKKLLLGYDHAFGKDRLTDDKQIKKIAQSLDFEVERLPKVLINQIPVSSTRIKNFISEKKIVQANELLGYPYLVEGKVVEGNRLGRKIGFPTANLITEYPEKLIPGPGVYHVQAKPENKWLHAVMNIGKRPTVDGKNLNMEVHILDYEGNLYGKILPVRFLKFLRNEKIFSGIEALKNQIQADINRVREELPNQS